MARDNVTAETIRTLDYTRRPELQKAFRKEMQMNEQVTPAPVVAPVEQPKTPEQPKQDAPKQG